MKYYFLYNKIFLFSLSLIIYVNMGCNNKNGNRITEDIKKSDYEQKIKDDKLKEKEKQELVQKEAEIKRTQDSILKSQKPENFCVGTWKKTINELLGKKIDKPSDILTLKEDKTYRQKLIMADGFSAKFETGIWDIKNNELILTLIESDYSSYVESMHYELKNNKLILKYWRLQNGEKSTIKEMDMKEVFQKISK